MFDRLADAIDRVEARENVAAMKADPATFRNNLRVDIGEGRVVTLGSVQQPWQQADFEALDPGWQSMVHGEPRSAPYYRGYFERGRGHSKTTDIAAQSSWALFSAPRQLVGVVGAGSEEQAGMLRDTMEKMLRLNAWLSATLTAHRDVVRNNATGSELTVLASDEHTTFGHTPDFVVLDELTHWKKRGLWTSLFSSIAKRPRCVLSIISNAGMGQGVSWQWDVREMARTDPAWYFHALDGVEASWITNAQLAEQRKGLTAKDYNRLWRNLWQKGTGDALNVDLLYKAAELVPGPMFQQKLPAAVAGLDLGQTHDHCAFVINGLDIHRRKIVLQHAHRWAPEDHGGRIPLALVRKHVLEWCQRLHVDGLAYDPNQCELMAEDLRAAGVQCFRYEFTPKNCHEMATVMLECLNNGMLELFDHAGLLLDLARLNIEMKTVGYKLDAPRDERGHCDLATAYVISLPWCVGTLDGFSEAA